jgi:hypothetical protein
LIDNTINSDGHRRIFINLVPEHARSQVKGGHSSGEIELIQACDWLTADSTLDFQREFYACLAIVAKYKQSIWNFSSKICYFFTLKSIENN